MQGLDIPDIEIVIQYGLCTFLVDLQQRFGRNVRLKSLFGLCLLIAEDWAYTPSTDPSFKERRTSQDVKDYVVDPDCERQFFAHKSDDCSEDGRFTFCSSILHPKKLT